MAERIHKIATHLSDKDRPSLHYTAHDGPLSLEQRQHYEDHGFVVVPGIFDPKKDLAPIHEKYLEICRNPANFVNKTSMCLDRFLHCRHLECCTCQD